MKKTLLLLSACLLTTGIALAQGVWDGDTSGNWATGTNWVGDTTPTFGTTQDIQISGTANLDQAINSHRIIRSLTFTDLNDGATTLELARVSDSANRDLRMSSSTGTASITVASGSDGDKAIGTGAAGEGEIEMFNNLNITHNGNGILRIRSEIRDDSTPNDLTIAGAGEIIILGVNTYLGDTTINGSDVLFANNSGLSFEIDGAGVNNSVGGTGNVEFKADFTFDLTGASSTVGDSWNIVDVGTLSALNTDIFHSQFAVAGFTQLSNVWTGSANGVDYEFAESTGTLTVVPEPSTIVLALVFGLGFLATRRRLTK